MATITDRQGHLVATVNVETGGFEWKARELAPPMVQRLIAQSAIRELTGGPEVEGLDVDYGKEMRKGTPEWAEALAYYVPMVSEDALEWHD